MSKSYDVVSLLSEVVIHADLFGKRVHNDERPVPDSSITGGFPALVFEAVSSRGINQSKHLYESTIQATILGLRAVQKRRDLINLERSLRHGLTALNGCVNGLQVISIQANQPIPDPDPDSDFIRFTTDYRITFTERS